MIRAVVLALACALVMSACGEDRLFGTELEKKTAPDFTLTDGVTGKSLTLSSLRKSTSRSRSSSRAARTCAR